MTLSPSAYLREAERLQVMARIAWADGDIRGAQRARRLAMRMERRAR